MALITALDYNTLQTKIATVLGVGSGQSGYGQALTSSSVNTGTNVATALHWLALRYDVIRARQHQTGINQTTNIVAPVTGTVITSVLRDSIETMADLCITDKLISPPNTQATREALVTPQTYTTAWHTVLTQTITIDFADANAARYFFNTGSTIEFSAGRVGGTVNTKNALWTAMLASDVILFTRAMGVISFNYTQTACSGTGNTSSIGWYDLTTVNQLVFKKAALSGVSYVPYSLNSYEIFARAPTLSQLVFTIEFRDDATGVVDENVDGTLTSTVQVRRASGSNVTVATPTAITSGLA